MVLTSTRFLIATLVVAFSWLVPGLAQVSEDIKPSYVFSSLGQWENHKLDVDASTVTTWVDKDGDTQVAAVFQITMTPAISIAHGEKIKTFIDAVIGVCGYDGVLVANSKAYDETGKLVTELTEPQPYRDLKRVGTAPTEMYKFLCQGVMRNTPAQSYI